MSGFDWEQISTWFFGIIYSRFKLYAWDSTLLPKIFPPCAAPLWFFNMYGIIVFGSISFVVLEKKIVVYWVIYDGFFAKECGN